jgi:hypothetical protein
MDRVRARQGRKWIGFDIEECEAKMNELNATLKLNIKALVWLATSIHNQQQHQTKPSLSYQKK